MAQIMEHRIRRNGTVLNDNLIACHAQFFPREIIFKHGGDPVAIPLNAVKPCVESWANVMFGKEPLPDNALCVTQLSGRKIVEENQ